MSSKFKKVLDGYFLSQDSMYYIFLETLGKIQFNDNDPSNRMVRMIRNVLQVPGGY